MRKIFTLLMLMSSASIAFAQDSNKTTTSGNIVGLSVPASPAFSITDIVPTLVRDPSTPKAFALGVAQASADAGTIFPNNYSAEFAPVWWLDPKGISVYSYLGIPKPVNGQVVKENVFSGLKFTSLSIAFVSKDLIPDTAKATQNIFSIGAHTTLIKIYGNEHARKLDTAIRKWHDDAQKELNANALLIDEMSRLDPGDPNYAAKVKQLQQKYKQIDTPNDLKRVNDLIIQKPIFNWDLSGAIAVYGLDNQSVQTSRAGVWTSVSTNIPLGKIDNGNYLNINAIGRYLYDRYQLNDNQIIAKANNIDAGGNLGFAFNHLSIGVESLYRFTNGVANTQNRTVGIINVRLTDRIYVNGTFGKDFAGPNRLISIFGINWGFGNEKLELPDVGN